MDRTWKKGATLPDGGQGQRPGRMYAAGLYARLSVDAEERKRESIEAQLAIARAFVESQPDMEVHGTYTDIGKTGTDFKREGFARMMQDVRAKKIDCIVVKDLSRFARNHMEAGNYIERVFPFLGVRFIAVTDHFDSMAPAGQGESLSVALKNLIHELYARDISAKVRSSRSAMREQGGYVGGAAPYGYRAEWKGGKKILRVEEEASEVVQKIYGLFLSGNHLGEIVAWLLKNRIERPGTYRRTGRVYGRDGEETEQWSRSTVKMLLTNPVYAGRMGKGPETDSGVRQRVHEAIVSEHTFDEAARRLAQTSADFHGRDASKPVPMEEDAFAGIVFCGVCGRAMKRRSAVKKSVAGDRHRTYRYCCPAAGRSDSGRCAGESIGQCALTRIAGEAVRQEIALSALRPEGLAERIWREGEAQKNAWDRKRLEIERRMGRLVKSGSEQYLNFRTGVISEERFSRVREENRRQMALYQERHAAIMEKIRGIGSRAAEQREAALALMEGRGVGQWTAEAVRALARRIEIYPGRRVRLDFAFRRRAAWPGEEVGEDGAVSDRHLPSAVQSR